MSDRLPFKDSDSAHQDHQYLEELATAYWYSEVLFAAIDLEIFTYLDSGFTQTSEIADKARYREHELERLMKTLACIQLIGFSDAHWFNNPMTARFLVKGKKDYLGDYLLYRRFMKPNWENLADKIVAAPDKYGVAESQGFYPEQVYNYLRSADTLMRRKAPEIADALKPYALKTPILDVGGGTATLSRCLLSTFNLNESDVKEKPIDLVELSDVIDAAKRLYPDSEDWAKINAIKGDFRTMRFEGRKLYGMVILSNFLHAYGTEEAKDLAAKASKLAAEDGVIIIHDYFPDRQAVSRHKGCLYDLNMMLNTFNGVCHKASEIMDWLKQAGFSRQMALDLSTDSSLILVGRNVNSFNIHTECSKPYKLSQLIHSALEFGFEKAVPLQASEIVTMPWVRQKCRFGCENYGSNYQCPPYSMDWTKTNDLLSKFNLAILTLGTPPARDFHHQLLKLEKTAFLSGFHKSFAMGAGPCSICDPCPLDDRCLNPKDARPSMESVGIDVFQTASKAGLKLWPLTECNQYVRFIGCLLLE